jgi:hypothetical protein
MNMIQTLEAEQIAALGKDIPDFSAGDTIRVGYKVTEGTRSRVQAYEGVCIAATTARDRGELHRPQDQLRRGRRARLPAALAQHRLDHRGPPRQGRRAEALLPARASRQVGPHRREDELPRTKSHPKA